MKSPFEDNTLRKQICTLIDLQYQGKFLVSTRNPESDAPPLPTLKELGLRRGRYPIDYEANWGRFKIDYANSVLVLIDGTPPAELLPQPRLQLATAIIQASSITLRAEDGSDPGLAFELHQAESDYRFIRRINALLRADRQPYIVWKLEWAEDQNELEPISIANDSALIFASSAVWSPEDHQLVAALIASPTRELLTALRATLANHHGKGWITVKGGSHSAYLHGAKRGFLHVSSQLAKANAVGVTSVLLHPLSGNPQEETEEYFYVVATPGETLAGKFAERLALAIAWPTRPEWAAYLLQAGQEAKLIQNLPVAGPDFAAALRVSRDEAGWQAVITQGLKSGALTI